MTPFEGVLLAHDGPLCSAFPQLYQISFLLATQPYKSRPYTSQFEGGRCTTTFVDCFFPSFERIYPLFTTFVACFSL
jgi:hypothetical protein